MIAGFENTAGLTEVGCEPLFHALADPVTNSEIMVSGKGLDGLSVRVAGEYF